MIKEECINHVTKRMGTRHRRLKEQLKEEVVTKAEQIQRVSAVGGRDVITDGDITNLQKYYVINVRNNHRSVEDMKN